MCPDNYVGLLLTAYRAAPPSVHVAVTSCGTHPIAACCAAIALAPLLSLKASWRLGDHPPTLAHPLRRRPSACDLPLLPSSARRPLPVPASTPVLSSSGGVEPVGSVVDFLPSTSSATPQSLPCFPRPLAMKILALTLLRALPHEEEATTLAAAYHLRDFNYFQRGRYVFFVCMGGAWAVG